MVCREWCCQDSRDPIKSARFKKQRLGNEADTTHFQNGSRCDGETSPTNQSMSATFRFLCCVPLVVCATTLGQDAAAQKALFDRYRNPGQTAQAGGEAHVPDSLRVVNGQLYDLNDTDHRDASWKFLEGDVEKVFTNRIVISTFTWNTIYGASTRSIQTRNYLGHVVGSRTVPTQVQVGTEKAPGKKFILRNYPENLSPTVGQTIQFTAMRVGTSDYNGDTLELWDYGTKPTQDELSRWRDEQAERQRAAETKLAQQREAAAEKAAAAKQATQVKVLKWHMEQAEKGDSFGLFRMGEHYRDGDGVPRDLDKAREYFTKAAAAGSPAAADALSKLNQVSTNAPARP